MGSELERRLIRVITKFAQLKPASAGLIRTEIQSEGLTQWSERRRAKAIIGLGTGFRTRSQFGRLRATLLVGVAHLGTGFLAQFERAGLLLSDDQRPKKCGEFLTDLGVELDEAQDHEWSALRDRIRSYQAYHHLLLTASADERTLRRLLKTPPRHIIKNVLALTSLSFLRQYFKCEVSADLEELLSGFRTPEQLASVASVLIAVANHHRPLDSWDFGSPATGDLLDPDLWTLLRYGRVLVECHAIAKHMSLFGYRFEEREAAGRKVYYLAPPFAAFEYALRLGYIRGQIGAGGRLEIGKQNAVPELSLATAAEFFVKRWRGPLAELRDPGTPFRRIRTIFPIVPELYRTLGDLLVFDDVAQRETLAQDFLFPLRRPSDPAIPLTPTMTLDEFLRIWRVIRFQCLVDIAAVRPYSDSDHTAFLNSLVRVSREAEGIEMITALGVDASKAREFLELVSASVHSLGYYDLQYRPLLRIAQVDVPSRGYTTAPEIIHVPAVVATSNVLRNVQIANKIRLAGMPHLTTVRLKVEQNQLVAGIA